MYKWVACTGVLALFTRVTDDEKISNFGWGVRISIYTNKHAIRVNC